MEVVNQPGLYQGYSVAFDATVGTRAKLLCGPFPPMVLPAIAGEVARPSNTGEPYDGVHQRVLMGGGRIMHGKVFSSDNAALSLIPILATHLATLPAGVHAITGTNKLTVAAAGWNPLTGAGGISALSNLDNILQVGDMALLWRTDLADADNLSVNDGVLAGPVTAVDATSFTVASTNWTNDAGVDQGCMVFKAAQMTRKGIPANSGNADATPPVQLLGGTQDPDLPSQPDLGDQIGWNNAWFLALAAAPGAGERVDVTARVGRY